MRNRVRIIAKNFRAAYNDFLALDISSVKIEGNVVAVIGHNGAGKSTLIKSILELLQPSQGTLHTSLQTESGRIRLRPDEHMAFCPETGSVFADIPVESYIRLWCRIKHQDPNYYRKAGSKYVELLQLTPLLPKLGRELSKGQRRRVQTAIGFLCEPKLFLFDEPFDGLDVQKTSELAQIIEDNSKHMTFLVSSHRMDVVERLADMVVVLKEGKVACCGSVEEVCRELCGDSLVVSQLHDPGKAYDLLRSHFPHLLINHVGNQVRVAGRDLKQADIQNLLRQHDKNGFQINHSSPGLVDAMNYHLKSLPG